MQSFDSELFRLIQSGEVDRETALSYATNRTNLQLRLETQSGMDKVESVKPAPLTPPAKSGTGAFRRAPAPKPDSDGLDDLIER
jgi:hypothetical protein